MRKIKFFNFCKNLYTNIVSEIRIQVSSQIYDLIHENIRFNKL